MRTNDDLVDDVESGAEKYLGGKRRSAAVLAAMRSVDRRIFLPSSPPVEAYKDEALPIGSGQTCSEPSMAALMLDLLEIEAGHRVLEIGSGSGYAAAVAALLCAPGGVVYACERIGVLAESMATHLASWRARLLQGSSARSAARIEILRGDGSAGFPALAPFDRILLSAGVAPTRIGRGFSEAPLLGQLAEDGVMVYPETVGNLHRVRKGGEALRRETWSGVAFVPLRGRNA